MAHSAHCPALSVFLFLSGLAGLLSGCASGHAGEPHTPIGVSATIYAEEPDLAVQEKSSEDHSETIVEEAARPFVGYRRADAMDLGEEQLLTYLAAADAVCIGERHDSVLDHFGQLRTIEGFLERRAMRGFELGLGLEMVRQEDQETLTAYEKGKIDDAAFEEFSRWKKEWGFPIEFYRPQLQSARDGSSALLALGVTRSLTEAIAGSGISSLPPERQAALPKLDRSNDEHRRLFDLLMEGHPGSEEKMDNYYEAQLVWDESMASLGSDWLSSRVPGRKLIILAGTAHCHRSAIPSRLARRSGLRVVNLLMVDKGQSGANKGNESSIQEMMVSGYDYQMVFAR